MAIKMRVRKDNKGVCSECEKSADKVLDMFDLCVGGNIFTLCDECVDTLFGKTLKATNYVNGRVKSQKDIAIKNARNSKKIHIEKRSIND